MYRIQKGFHVSVKVNVCEVIVIQLDPNEADFNVFSQSMKGFWLYVCMMAGIFSVAGNLTDESTSLCSLSALSHLSSDAINSVPQSPQYPPKSSLRHSATFDEGTKSMSAKEMKKKKSKNLFKRLLNSSNSNKAKSPNNVTFYQSQPGIPEGTNDTSTDQGEQPKDYSQDVSTL